MSGFGLNAFAQGAMQGANFIAGLQGEKERRQLLRDREARLEQGDARRQQQFELNQKFTQMKLQGLEKAKDDADALRKLTAAQYALTAAKDPAVAHLIQANPRFRQMARDGLQIAAHQVIGEGGPAGARKRLDKLVPLPNGKLAVDLTVTRADGTTYTAPVTEGRTDDPNEPVAQFTPEQLIRGIGSQKAVIAMIQAARIAHGDTSPIETAQAAKEIQAEHDWEIRKMIAQAKLDRVKAERDAANNRKQAEYEASLKRDKPTYKTGADGTLYAIRGGQAEPVTTGGGYGLAPQGTGVTPQQASTEQALGGNLLLDNPPQLAQGTRTGPVPVQVQQGGENGAPAAVQTIEWMAANLTGGDKQAAYRLYNQGKSNPRELAASIYSKLVKDNEARIPSQRRTPDQLWAATQETVRRIYGDPMLNPLVGGQQAAPQTATTQAQGVAPPSTAPQALPTPAQGLGAASAGQESANVPPASALKEGVRTTFANGQTWMLANGRPVRVR